MQMQRWGVSKMVYNVLFHWHERRISQVSFSNLSKFTKTGYELIRQVVDAAARQKFGREIKWDFWMLCMFCLNKIGLNNRYTTNLFTLFNIDQFYYLFTKIRSCAMITNTNFRIPILSQPDVVEI